MSSVTVCVFFQLLALGVSSGAGGRETHNVTASELFRRLPRIPYSVCDELRVVPVVVASNNFLVCFFFRKKKLKNKINAFCGHKTPPV